MTSIPKHHPQKDAWEREYRSPQLLALSDVPHAEVVKFVKWIKKGWRNVRWRSGDTSEEAWSMEGKRVLDLGSGNGRNAIYFGERGAEVIGYEIAPTAVKMARELAAHRELPGVTFEERDIGTTYLLESVSCDVVLDITASNSLSEAGRAIYLNEVARVLRPGGLLLVRLLALEGDRHAERLLETSPGAEVGTYRLPGVGVVERVLSKAQFVAEYEPNFEILELKRVEHYAEMNGQRFKRAYWVGYLKRRE